MRALAITMKDPEVMILVTDLAADYENLPTGRPRGRLGCRQVVDAQAPTMPIYPGKVISAFVGEQLVASPH